MIAELDIFWTQTCGPKRLTKLSPIFAVLPSEIDAVNAVRAI